MAEVIALPREYLIIESGYYADTPAKPLFLVSLRMEDRSDIIFWSGESRQDATSVAEEIARDDGLRIIDKAGVRL